jgi:ADP-heptose:LPS heptosyltransferase
MDIERSGWHRLFLDRPDPRGLPVSLPDVVVAFMKDDGRIRNNLMTYFPHIPVYLFPSLPNEDQSIHVARYISECVRSADLPIDPQESIDKARRSPLMDAGRPKVPSRELVFHPGSGDSKKNYSSEFWLRLVEHFGGKSVFPRFNFVFLLGPAEEMRLAEFQKTQSSMQIRFSICPDADSLIALLTGASLYVGHDSGITHLAAMLGVPTIALFRNTNPLQWGPLGPKVEVINNEDSPEELLKKVRQVAGKFLHIIL